MKAQRGHNVPFRVLDLGSDPLEASKARGRLNREDKWVHSCFTIWTQIPSLDFKILCWNIPNMHSSGSWVLRGSWTSKYNCSAVVVQRVFDCSFPGQKFHVLHTRFRSTLKSLRTVFRLSRLIRFGFRVRPTRCTRVCEQRVVAPSSGGGSWLRLAYRLNIWVYKAGLQSVCSTLQ